MSRNLCATSCWIVLAETPRPITKDEAGCYFDEYEGMLVANTDCPDCGAKYLAWVNDLTKKKRYGHERGPDIIGVKIGCIERRKNRFGAADVSRYLSLTSTGFEEVK